MKVVEGDKIADLLPGIYPGLIVSQLLLVHPIEQSNTHSYPKAKECQEFQFGMTISNRKGVQPTTKAPATITNQRITCSAATLSASTSTWNTVQESAILSKHMFLFCTYQLLPISILICFFNFWGSTEPATFPGSAELSLARRRLLLAWWRHFPPRRLLLRLNGEFSWLLVNFLARRQLFLTNETKLLIYAFVHL